MDHKWDQIQKIFQRLTKLVEDKFPDVPILSSFGNNDMMYNAEMPGKDQAGKDSFLSTEAYFTAIYQYWFTDVKANMKLLKSLSQEKLKQFENDFKHGGYYAIDLNEKLTIVSFNSIAWCERNQNYIGKIHDEPDYGQDQAKWYRDLMES